MTVRPLSQQILRMTGAGTDPDPAVFCPLNGYVPDPAIYVPPEIIESMPTTGDGEIQLLCNNQGSKHIEFNASISNSGKFRVIVYNSSNVSVSNTLSNNYATFKYDFTTDNYYRILIKPELGANSILGFSFVGNYTLYPDISWRVIAAKIKCPSLTGAGSMFNALQYITDIEFIGPHDQITGCSNVASNCPELLSIQMPTSLNKVTSLSQALYNSPKVIKLTLPDSLPLCTEMVSMLYKTSISTFTFPSSLPKLTTVANFASTMPLLKYINMGGSYPELTRIDGFAQSCPKLKTAVIPISMPKIGIYGVTYMFVGCPDLEGEFTFPSMPLCGDMYAVFGSNKVTKVTFTGTMDVLTRINNLVSGCAALTDLVFPTSMKKMNLGGFSSAIVSDFNLKNVTLPDAFDFATTQDTDIFSIGWTTSIENIVWPTQWPAKMFNFNGTNLIKVGSLNCPNARLYNVQWGLSYPTPPAGTYWAMSYFEIAWELMFEAGISKTPQVSFYYCALTLSEINRIIGRLPEKPAAFVNNAGVNFIGCSGAAGNVTVNFNGWYLADNRKWVRSGGGTLASLYVGMEICTPSYAKFVTRNATLAASIFTKVGHNMPEGTEISFRVLTGITGILLWHKYIIVNVTVDTFQVAEIEVGTPITITGSGAVVYSAFPHIMEIGATWIRVDFQNETPISTDGPAVLNTPIQKSLGWHKGWLVQ